MTTGQEAKENGWLIRCKDAGIPTGISTYASPQRLHNGQIIEMIELAKKIGTDEITIFDVVPTGHLLTEDKKHLLNDEDKAELCRIEEEYNEGRPLSQVITQAHINGPTGNGCFAGWCQFYVTGIRRYDSLRFHAAVVRQCER